MDFLERLEHIIGPEVDRKLRALCQPEIGPSPLKHMRKGEEIKQDIFLAYREHGIVGTESFVIHGSREHHAFAVTRRTTGVEDIDQVIEAGVSCPAFYVALQAKIFAQSQEIVKVNGEMVIGILPDGRVKNDYSLHSRTKRHNAECHVILLLLSHKDITDFGVADHINHLRTAACGIERNRHGPYGIGAEIDVKAFGLVLGKDCQLLLHADTKRQQRA